MEIACALIPEPSLADPLEAGELTERLLRQLEGIGAAVESERVGQAFFAVDGLRRMHGGGSAEVVEAARRVSGGEARIGTGPTRFDACLAASAWERPAPIAALAGWIGLPGREADGFLETLGRLGIETLEALAALPADRVADRFGPPGLRALRLARGEEGPLCPRRPYEEPAAEVELPEGAAGAQLERALELLVDRLLGDPRRRGRTVLALRLAARLAAGGSWSTDQGLGRPTGSARVLRAVLAPRLAALPGPAAALRLRALGLGPPAPDQLELSVRGAAHRRRRLGDAIREVRIAQGADSLLEIIPLDPASRLPERRAILTPTADR